jgi:hypothetical protein
MKNDLKITLAIFSVVGIFIFIKGFQDNLSILDIFTIFVTFIIFSIGFALLTASLIDIISWILTSLFKKYEKKIKNIKYIIKRSVNLF